MADYDKYLEMPPDKIKSLQKSKGWAVYFIGCVVFFVLTKLKFQTKSFYGVYPYFEIGSNWGGIALGSFFICSKNFNDRLKSHEIGHCIQNISIGGFKMMILSACSTIRCLFRDIFNIQTPYDSWWFEGQATDIGLKYVAKYKQQ